MSLRCFAIIKHFFVCGGAGDITLPRVLFHGRLPFFLFVLCFLAATKTLLKKKWESQLPESWGFRTTIKDKNAGIINSGIHKHELSSSFIKMAATIKNTTMIPDNTLNTINSRSFIRSALVNICGSYLYNAE